MAKCEYCAGLQKKINHLHEGMEVPVDSGDFERYGISLSTATTIAEAARSLIDLQIFHAKQGHPNIMLNKTA